MQQTSDHNRKAADSQTQNKLVVTSGGVGIKNWGVGGKAQTIGCKIGYQDVLYSTGNIVVFCNNYRV